MEPLKTVETLTRILLLLLVANFFYIASESVKATYGVEGLANDWDLVEQKD